jgi:hypothetical protein
MPIHHAQNLIERNHRAPSHCWIVSEQVLPSEHPVTWMDKFRTRRSAQIAIARIAAFSFKTAITKVRRFSSRRSVRCKFSEPAIRVRRPMPASE